MTFFGAIKALGSLTLGGGIRRMVAGGAIGGIYGAATSEAASPTNVFRDVMTGAAAGIGIGGLTTRAARTVGFGALKRLPRVAWGGAKLGGRAAYGAGRFIFNRPKTALALGAGGLGMYGLATSGAGASELSTEEMSAIATAHGISSSGFAPGMGAMGRQDSRQMFMESTHGLTLGLHHGRHR